MLFFFYQGINKQAASRIGSAQPTSFFRRDALELFFQGRAINIPCEDSDGCGLGSRLGCGLGGVVSSSIFSVSGEDKIVAINCFGASHSSPPALNVPAEAGGAFCKELMCDSSVRYWLSGEIGVTGYI